MNIGSLGIPLSLNFWILQSIAMGLTALVLPKLRITNPFGALGSVVALAFVNAHIWDAALFFSIPHTLTNQTITLVLANGLLFWLIVKILPGIESDGILAPLLAPIIFTAFSLLIGQFGRDLDILVTIERVVNSVISFKSELISSTPPSP